MSLILVRYTAHTDTHTRVEKIAYKFDFSKTFLFDPEEVTERVETSNTGELEGLIPKLKSKQQGSKKRFGYHLTMNSTAPNHFPPQNDLLLWVQPHSLCTVQ